MATGGISAVRRLRWLVNYRQPSWSRRSTPRLRLRYTAPPVTLAASPVGLTGREADVRLAQVNAQVEVATVDPSATLPAGGGYSVNHSGVVYAYTPDNLDHLIYFGGVKPSGEVSDFVRLVRNGWQP
jgi:hypothetical protein